MIGIYSEEIKSDFEGTIIDLETIGYFDDRYVDSRRYRHITPIIFGFITKEGIRILCAKREDLIPKLKEDIIEVLDTLIRPFYAFNTDFERGVLFNHIGKKIKFEGELNGEKFESKRRVIQSLGIPNYRDPFNDNGLLCLQSWLKGKFENAISHNRSCLLKERDILLKRGFRKPSTLKFIR